MNVHCTRSRRSSLRSTRPGFSLIELVLTMVVMGMVAAMLTPLLLTARRMVLADQTRTQANQSLRTSSDLIGADVRIAGERFPRGGAFQLPPIQIVTGDSADELLLRRNLWEGTFPVCAPLSGGTSPTVVQVVQDDAWLTTPPGEDYPECGQPTGTDNWPVSLSQVRSLAAQIGTGQDSVMYGFLFDPAATRGEFIRFRVESDANTSGAITRVNTGPLAFDYPLENRPRIYVMEERRYRTRDGILELVINADTANSLRVAADVTAFRARFILADGSEGAAVATGSTWRDIRAMQIAVGTQVHEGRQVVNRELVSRFFPRNALSR